MATTLAERMNKFSGSPTSALIAKVAELKRQGKDIISLNVGEPDFGTPDYIKVAGMKAIADNFTKYTPGNGILELRQEIVKKLREDNGVEYALNEVTTAVGAKQAIASAMMVLAGPGDEVLLPIPCWVSIISDVMMPVMDGLEMIRQIKENNNICHIPIIVLSAKASLDDRIAGLEQGIDDYITKPFSATYLKTRIASLLRQRKSLQEIYMAKLTEGKEIAVAEALTPSQPQITPYDEQFMQKVMEFIEEQMDNAELTIDEFAEHLMLSRTIFYRKLKSIIGLTPVDFIREVRIKRAAQLIDSGEYNFSQVAYMTGFNDPKYFSKCFKKVVGITPSEYKEKNK